MTNKLSINAEYVRLAAAFCAKEGTRYYLKGVQVEPHPSGVGVLIMATNGHLAGIFYDRSGHANKNYLLELDKPTIAAMKATKSDNKNRLLTIKNEHLTITHKEGREHHIKPNRIEIDGKFPDLRRVIPSEYNKGANLALHIDANLLQPFIAVSKSLTSNGHVVLTPSERCGPISCRVNHDDFMGLLMSVNSDVEDPIAPWLDDVISDKVSHLSKVA